MVDEGDDKPGKVIDMVPSSGSRPALGSLPEDVRRAYLKPFKPGVSNNPSGQSALYHACRKIAREAAPDMMHELVKLALYSPDDRVKSICLLAVLDRAGVKPMEYDPNADPDAKPKLDVEKLTPEQRDQLRGLIKAATG